MRKHIIKQGTLVTVQSLKATEKSCVCDLTMKQHLRYQNVLEVCYVNGVYVTVRTRSGDFTYHMDDLSIKFV